jgi:putative SOS response-associated peptidase YedK
MCNDYRLRTELVGVEKALEIAGLTVGWPEGRPNLELRADIRITDRAPIVRMGAAGPELAQRRWSWPGPGGKPVYNFRSDGREFSDGRCLILADGFYEFTAPADPKAKRKRKWLFTLNGSPVFGIAGLWRTDAAVGEVFTMLTCPPGPDVAAYHNRSIIPLAPPLWPRWLDPAVPARELLQPLPAGSLSVQETA